jgi:hypothetical protein
MPAYIQIGVEAVWRLKWRISTCRIGCMEGVLVVEVNRAVVYREWYREVKPDKACVIHRDAHSEVNYHGSPLAHPVTRKNVHSSYTWLPTATAYKSLQ